MFDDTDLRTRTVRHGRLAHYPNLERPDEFTRLVLDFLDATAQRR